MTLLHEFAFAGIPDVMDDDDDASVANTEMVNSYDEKSFATLLAVSIYLLLL